MKRFCVILVFPFLLAGACEERPHPLRVDWLANEVDQARLERLAADPWLRPEQSGTGGTMAAMNPDGHRPLLVRPNIKRWSEDPLPGDPYDALAAEIGAAREAGWFVTGVYCWNSVGFHGDGRASETLAPNPAVSVNRIAVGFAKPSDDLDHAQAAFLFEGLGREFEASSSNYVPKGRIVVGGVAPHHADRGWPKYVPVELADTCIADPHHPRLPTSDEEPPKTNPPPPEEESSHGPLDQSGKPFATWDRSARFSESGLEKLTSTTSATPST